METTQKIAQVNRGGEIQSRRKYNKEHEGEIVAYANAFGILAAMDRFDVRSGFTIQRMMERRGNE